MGEKIRKSIFIAMGWLFLAIGVIGVFLPLLPTTPFLLLAAVFFNKGSEKFHDWLLNHKVFGPPIQDWRRHRAIRIQYKILSTTMMLLSVYVILQRPNIPDIGKTAFCTFVTAMLAFIWTRNSHRT